jgi:hypothetical protein
MPEFDDEFSFEDVQHPSKAAERRAWRSCIQTELDDLGDLYELPEGIRIPGVRV